MRGLGDGRRRQETAGDGRKQWETAGNSGKRWGSSLSFPVVPCRSLMSIFFISFISFVSCVYAAPTVKDVTSSLVCKCGCGNMLISACECTNAQMYRAIVEQQIKAGMSKEEILDSLVKMTASQKLKELAERVEREGIMAEAEVMADFQRLLREHGVKRLTGFQFGDVAYFLKNCGRGEEILGAPKAKGVHLIGWTLPFILLLVSGGVIGAFLMRLKNRAVSAKPAPESAPVSEPKVPQPSASNEYEAKLDEELKKFDF